MVIDMNYWNKVIKNIVILALSIVAVYLFFKLAVFFMPFLVAFIISLMLEPIIRFIMKKTKLTRKASSIIVFILAIAIICGILVWAVTTLITEASNLLTNLNSYIDTGYNFFQKIVSSIDLSRFNIPEDVMSIIQNSGLEFIETITDWAKGALTKVIDFITSVPTLGVYCGITLIALYFMCVDKIYMIDQLEHHLPETWVKRIGVHLKALIKSLGGYLKAELILVLISFVISLIGLYIFYFIGWNVQFPLIIAIRNSICRCFTYLWFRHSYDSMGRNFGIFWRYEISNRNICFMVRYEYSKAVGRATNSKWTNRNTSNFYINCNVYWISIHGSLGTLIRTYYFDNLKKYLWDIN